MLRNELVPVDRQSGERQAQAGEVKRLGDGAAVIEFESNNATVEIAARVEHRALVTGPFTIEATPSPPPAAPVSQT